MVDEITTEKTFMKSSIAAENVEWDKQKKTLKFKILLECLKK